MAIIARPPITPGHVDRQLVQVSTNSQKQKATVPAPAIEADDSVRHPVTGKWTRQYQNNQIADKSMDTKVSGE